MRLLSVHGFKDLHGLLVFFPVHEAQALPQKALANLFRAVPVIAQVLEYGGSLLIVARRLLLQRLPVAQPGLEITDGAEGADPQAQQQGQHQGGDPPRPVARVFRRLRFRLRRRLNDDGGGRRGLAADGGGKHRDGGDGHRGRLRPLLRRGRVDQVGIHMLFQPEPIRAAADAAQAPLAVGQAAGTYPKPLLAAEIAVVPHVPGAGPGTQSLIVGVRRPDRHRRESQIFPHRGLVPGAAVGKADPLGKDLRKYGPLYRDLHRLVVAENPAGPRGETGHGHQLQLGQPLPPCTQADHPQEDLADLLLGAVDQPGLEQAFSALQVQAQLDPAHPGGTVRRKQLLTGGRQDLKPFVLHVGRLPSFF